MSGRTLSDALYSPTARALAVQVEKDMRRSVLVDVLTVHGAAAGKSIIFVQTKRDADEVAAGVAQTMPCEVRLSLHSEYRLPSGNRRDQSESVKSCILLTVHAQQLQPENTPPRDTFCRGAVPTCVVTVLWMYDQQLQMIREDQRDMGLRWRRRCTAT